MANEIVKYEIEDPFSGKKKMTSLRSRARRYLKRNYYVTEYRMVEVMISARESLSVLHTKEWKSRTE